jgi:hypothetical protein
MRIRDYVVISVIGFIFVVALAFATGIAQSVYNRTVGVEVTSSETDRFHASKGYVDGMVQDLSKYKLELAKTKDETARGAIIAHINEQFANFDEKNIQDEGLKQFLKDIKNGNIK